MLKKSIFGLFTIAALTASAATYHIELLQGGVVNGKQLKTGSYKLETSGNSVLIKGNKESTEVPARFESSNIKFASTMVRYGQNSEVQEIWVGGTKTKIIFTPAGSPAGGPQ